MDLGFFSVEGYLAKKYKWIIIAPYIVAILMVLAIRINVYTHNPEYTQAAPIFETIPVSIVQTLSYLVIVAAAIVALLHIFFVWSKQQYFKEQVRLTTLAPFKKEFETKLMSLARHLDTQPATIGTKQLSEFQLATVNALQNGADIQTVNKWISSDTFGDPRTHGVLAKHNVKLTSRVQYTAEPARLRFLLKVSFTFGTAEQDNGWTLIRTLLL